jgi:hypothetical protein
VEGNAWQYRFFVPHDIPGLIDVFGGTETFTKELNYFFQGALDLYNDTLLPNQYYWAGNEPDLMSAWLFGVAGRPDLTQKWTRVWNQVRASECMWVCVCKMSASMFLLLPVLSIHTYTSHPYIHTHSTHSPGGIYIDSRGSPGER